MDSTKYSPEEQDYLKTIVAAAVSNESGGINAQSSNVSDDMARMAVKMYDFAEILLIEHKKRLQ